jgi:hypothetical protein
VTDREVTAARIVWLAALIAALAIVFAVMMFTF